MKKKRAFRLAHQIWACSPRGLHDLTCADVYSTWITGRDTCSAWESSEFLVENTSRHDRTIKNFSESKKTNLQFGVVGFVSKFVWVDGLNCEFWRKFGRRKHMRIGSKTGNSKCKLSVEPNFWRETTHKNRCGHEMAPASISLRLPLSSRHFSRLMNRLTVIFDQLEDGD